jgi:hypothetical protein
MGWWLGQHEEWIGASDHDQILNENEIVMSPETAPGKIVGKHGMHPSRISDSGAGSQRDAARLQSAGEGDPTVRHPEASCESSPEFFEMQTMEKTFFTASESGWAGQEVFRA